MINTDITLEDLKSMSRNSMVEHLGIEFTSIGAESITAVMPVDHRTKQPMGLLHGGASVVLAETLGSVAANCSVDSSKYYCVGLDINANHLKSVKEGFVTGTTKAIHIGKTTQVWEILIRDQRDQLICISRLTMAVIAR